jgi:RNA polymerase sigma factor (sigma-70 family)
LVEQVRSGNTAAFEVIYDRHHAGILSFCRHLLGSREEAEDALQATFASAYVALRRDDAEMALKPWLYTLARNRCISLLRVRREQPAEIEEGLTEGLSSQVERRTELRELVADLAALPERQRSALVLAELGDLSHVQIADVLGCEAGQVKALVFQARSALLAARNARDTP